MSVYDHENDPAIFGGDNDPRLNDPPIPARSADAGVRLPFSVFDFQTGNVDDHWLREWCEWGIVELATYLRRHADFAAWCATHDRP